MQIPDLFRGLSHHEHLRSSLREAFPETDEDTISDTLEGLTDLPEIIAAVLSLLHNFPRW